MNAHTPFDAKQDWTNPYCQNSSNDPMVDALLGNAYHVVRTVYCNLGNLKLIYDFLNQYGMVLGVQSEAELKALTTKAKYARIYGFSRAGDRQVTDYLYVEGDRTGIIPDDPEATGSWITVATSGSNGGGTSSGEGAYIPWVYANGSATGGETSINVPDGTVGVPFIIINGDMQYVGRGFEFNADNLSVTLAQPLEEGDEVVFLLTGVPAVPDNPNVNDWVQINWLYNNGAAVGGEQVIAIPYTFQSVPAVYKNGLRLYKGLTSESYTADPDNQRILLTEPLTTNDRLIVQIGGEAQVLEASDHTLQEVARATNVKDSEVILSTDTTQSLNGKRVVYDVEAQKIYGIPSLPTNVYINSVSYGQLTYAPGNITVNLIPVPESGNELKQLLLSNGGAENVFTSSGPSVQESLDDIDKTFNARELFNTVGMPYDQGASFSTLTTLNGLQSSSGYHRGAQGFCIDPLNRKIYTTHQSETGLATINEFPLDGLTKAATSTGYSTPESALLGHQGLAFEPLEDDFRLWTTSYRDSANPAVLTTGRHVTRFKYVAGQPISDAEHYELFPAGEYANSFSSTPSIDPSGTYLIAHGGKFGSTTDTYIRVFRVKDLIDHGPGDCTNLFISHFSTSGLVDSSFPLQGLATDGRVVTAISGGSSTSPNRLYTYDAATGRVLFKDNSFSVGLSAGVDDGNRYEPEGLCYFANGGSYSLVFLSQTGPVSNRKNRLYMVANRIEKFYRGLVVPFDAAKDTVAGNVLSGSYTPVLTNETGVTSHVVYPLTFTRVGNVVNVSGRVDVTGTTADTAIQFLLDLPIATNMSTTYYLAGTGVTNSIVPANQRVACILGNAASNSAMFRFIPGNTASNTIFFTFSYQVR